MTTGSLPRVGICGSGFIARGVYSHLESRDDLEVNGVLTRRPLEQVKGFRADVLTNSAEKLAENCDILFECSGDAIHATDVLQLAGKAGCKLVTMNSELQITTGSWILDLGYYLTEALGDQPGCQAELQRDAIAMGFEPVCYLNIKGFLNTNPSRKDMNYWAKKQELALGQVVSFTDGTKLQIEQALVANGLGATIAEEGMIGRKISDLNELDYLIDRADEIGQPISDYVLNPGGPPGVMVLGKNGEMQKLPGYLPFSNLATAEGKGYRLLRPHHLCHLEVVKTLVDVANGAPPLLNNSARPTVTVVAVAKRDMDAGHPIERGLGSFDFRGSAVKIADHPDAIPITLLEDVRLTRNVKEGQIITLDDVDIWGQAAFEIYRFITEQS